MVSILFVIFSGRAAAERDKEGVIKGTVAGDGCCNAILSWIINKEFNSFLFW
jgi:hypothetical protein